jgi:threonine/homoserine/homoserine lactone efflux protein
MLLVLWATLAAVLFARGWVTHDPLSRAACLGGVLVGGAIWFLALAWLVSRAHRRVTPRALAWLARGCGVVFLIFAALLGHRLFW